MKFAKVFQQVLEEDNVPDEWKRKAIQYKALKKCINRVVEELEMIGLKKEAISFTYDTEKVEQDYQPQLRLRVSPLMEATILRKLRDLNYTYSVQPLDAGRIQEVGSTEDGESMITADNPFDEDPYYEITVHLHEDTKFFRTLYEELDELSEFKTARERELEADIEDIAAMVAKVGSPGTKKSDMYSWRKIFQLYIESEVFFSTRERGGGTIQVDQSRKRVEEFVETVDKQMLIKNFRRKNSLEAYQRFRDLNFLILKVSNYQVMNSIAVTKILKKFDKQTSLNSTERFPDLVAQSKQLHILNGSLTKGVCYLIAQRLLNIIPQIDDYTCPVCCSVAFKPIRLDCGHLFCVRCLVKLQRKDEDKCPLCRQAVVVHADERNLDLAQMAYLKLYFPKEVKEKQAENEKEIFKEQYGHIVDPDSSACAIS